MSDESRQSPPSPSPGTTCAIVVTYNPDAQFTKRLRLVAAQFPRVIIVDNGSARQSLQTLSTLSDDSAIKLCFNSTNLGIAEALNQGVSQALREGFVWGVTLDQDTVVFPDLLETLIAVHAQSGAGCVVVGGNYHNINKQKNYIDCKPGTQCYRECKTLITAGTMIPLEIARRIGGFRSDY
ncbi:MAG: glycosyltransferase, partial [Arenimonas sp.]